MWHKSRENGKYYVKKAWTKQSIFNTIKNTLKHKEIWLLSHFDKCSCTITSITLFTVKVNFSFFLWHISKIIHFIHLNIVYYENILSFPTAGP